MSHERAPRGAVADEQPAIAVRASVEIFCGYGHEIAPALWVAGCTGFYMKFVHRAFTYRQRQAARSPRHRTVRRLASGQLGVLSSAGAPQISGSVPARRGRSIERHSPTHPWPGDTSRAHDPACARKRKMSWLWHPTMVDPRPNTIPLVPLTF